MQHDHLKNLPVLAITNATVLHAVEISTAELGPKPCGIQEPDRPSFQGFLANVGT